MKYQQLLETLEQHNCTNENATSNGVWLGNTLIRNIKKPINHIKKYAEQYNYDNFSCYVEGTTMLVVEYTMPNCQDVYFTWDLK